MINLTPEEKAIGKGNFQAAIGSDLTRREFLMGTIAAGVVSGTGLGGMYFNYKKVENPVRIGFIGTGDEGGVLLGALTPDYVQVAAIADIRPYNQFRAFHGDCSSENAMKVRTGLIKKYDWKTEDNARKNVAVYEDYHDLLADKDKLGIEAVVIALPLHLHAPAAIAAMNKGLHVLTEKLMGYSVAACKAMGRVSKQTDMLLATGHQRHYSILYDNAVDCIRQGLLGDVHCIRAQWHRKADTWSPPVPTDPSLTKAELLEANLKKQELASANALGDLRKEYDALKSGMSDSDFKLADQWAHLKRTLANSDPKEVDLLQKRITQVEMQIKDAAVDPEKFGYHDFKLKGSGDEVKAREELIRWRLWERTGGGLMAELGSHQLDASGIFVGAIPGNPPHEKVLPLTVSAAGYQYLKRRECEDHVFCMYEFPKPGYYKPGPKTEAPVVADPNKKLSVTYSSINGNGYGDYGEVVMGDKGTLVLLQEKEVMLYKDADTKTSVGVAKTKAGGPTLDTTESGSAAAAVGKLATETGPPSRGYTEEIEHWAWCIRNRAPENLPKCHPKVALGDAVIALTTNLVLRDPSKNSHVVFDQKWFDIDDDATPENEAPDPKKYM